jgi:hypothetical protein
MKVLNEFCEMEKDFVTFLRNDKNWQIEGEDESGKKSFSQVLKTSSLEDECCG